MNDMLIKDRKNKTLFSGTNNWNGRQTNVIARYMVGREMGQNGRACVPRSCVPRACVPRGGHVCRDLYMVRKGGCGKGECGVEGVLAAIKNDLQRPGI